MSVGEIQYVAERNSSFLLGVHDLLVSDGELVQPHVLVFVDARDRGNV